MYVNQLLLFVPIVVGWITVNICMYMLERALQVSLVDLHLLENPQFQSLRLKLTTGIEHHRTAYLVNKLIFMCCIGF